MVLLPDLKEGQEGVGSDMLKSSGTDFLVDNPVAEMVSIEFIEFNTT